MKLFFRLGRNANLSYAELQSYFEFAKIEYKVIHVDANVAILEIGQMDRMDDKIKELIKELGGIVKIGKFLGEYSAENFKAEVKDVVVAELANYEGKKFFGFSLVGNYQKDFRESRDLNKFALEIKAGLDGSARVVSSKDIELSSVIVQKEKLLRRGGDFNLIYSGEKRFVGVTLAVQEFEEYNFRDYQRPGIDAKSGMLPPKLAKIMVNLSQTPKQSTVIDPFCGSGTVLVELLLKGYKKIIGSDISEKAIADSERNIAWAGKTFNVDVSEVQLRQGDARNISLASPVRAIVTEPLLGPALKGTEPRQQIAQIKAELEDLYRKAILNLSKGLMSGGSMILVVPIFVIGSEMNYMDIFEDLRTAGFERKTFENVENNKFRQPLVYMRAGQKVYREILVLKKA